MKIKCPKCHLLVEVHKDGTLVNHDSGRGIENCTMSGQPRPWQVGDIALHNQDRVKIVRPSYVRFGEQRVVVERERDQHSYTVGISQLVAIRPPQTPV